MSDEQVEQNTQQVPPPSSEDALIESLMAPESSDEGTSEADETEVTAVTTDDAQLADGSEEDETTDADEADEEGEVEESEDEEDEEDSEEDTEETEEEDEDEVSDEEEAESEFVFNIDGEGITLEEAQRGYLRNADYTQKTQELAQVREQMSQQVEAIKQHENVVAEHLTLALKVIEPQLAELANTDWDQLAQSDAYEYQEKRIALDQAQARYQQIQDAAKAMLAQRQQETEQRMNAVRSAEAEKLRLLIPDVADPKKGRELVHNIKTYAMDNVGLSEQEVGNIVDHRLIGVLNKARMYDELQAAGLSVAEKKVKKGPRKVISGGKPQSKTKQTARKTGEAKERLRSSGSTDDLVDILLSG